MPWWPLVIGGLVTLLLFALVFSTRGMGHLLGEQHMGEIHAGLDALKRAALDEEPQPLETSGPMLLCYTIARDDGGWIHHLSLSTPITPARSAGALLMAYVQAGLDLPLATWDSVLVSDRNVFHLRHVLDDEEHSGFVERPLKAHADVMGPQLLEARDRLLTQIG